MGKSDLDSILRPFAYLIRSGGADRVAVLMLADALEESGVDQEILDYLRNHVDRFTSNKYVTDFGWITIGLPPIRTGWRVRWEIANRMQDILKEDRR